MSWKINLKKNEVPERSEIIIEKKAFSMETVKDNDKLLRFIIQIVTKYQDFSFYKKSYLHIYIYIYHAVKILFSSFTCGDIGVVMSTNKDN